MDTKQREKIENIPTWLEDWIEDAERRKKEKQKAGWYWILFLLILVIAVGIGLTLTSLEKEAIVFLWVSLLFLTVGIMLLKQVVLRMQNPRKKYLHTLETAIKTQGEPLKRALQNPLGYTIEHKEEVISFLGDYLLQRYLTSSRLEQLDIIFLGAITKFKAVRYIIDGHTPKYRLNFFNSSHQIVKTLYFQEEEEIKSILAQLQKQYPERFSESNISL